ncbi:fumarylacetoacetate hydrolase family protein [Motiliproteus sediminis]|uniref:fumarylacetoacetate hydrolase family protein n=1 Tax=Motiliproteus sediminis TaxID=1468178 RepID=UPI001AEF5464|nr:fumarylacetoacetate hydrolase family protein [Motiliproteus sediminis]
MPYTHKFSDGRKCPLPAGKVVCVGRNYADHARELNNPVPDQPLLFIKPATALVAMDQPLPLPDFGGDCHFEAELAVLIGSPLTRAEADTTLAAVAGYGLGLDLTLRELQSELKQKGHPWEMAKAFDGSCPLSEFVAPEQLADVEDCEYRLLLNGQPQQHGQTRHMITPVSALLAYCSRYFTLMPGDVVLTGTPAGVGRLQSGDELSLSLANCLQVSAVVR